MCCMSFSELLPHSSKENHLWHKPKERPEVNPVLKCGHILQQSHCDFVSFLSVTSTSHQSPTRE